MKFNLNNKVKVKLTELGKEVLKRDHDKLFQDFDPHPVKFKLPEENENGWSEWQLWELMQKFGHVMYNGSYIPFETEIEILEEG